MPYDVDTTSYVKPPALPVQKGVLDQVQQYQQIESSGLQIDQQKLNQANQALGYMTRAMGSLGPDATKEEYLGVAQNAVKMGLVPAPMLKTYEERLAKAKDAPSFFNEFMTAAQGHQEQLDYHLGRPGNLPLGNANQAITTSQKPGFGQRSTGLPVAINPGPDRVEYGKDGQAGYRDVQPPQTAPGMVSSPPPAPGVILPVARDPGTFAPPPGTPLTPNQVVSQNSPTPAAPSPLFEEGKKLFSQHQQEASAVLAKTQPAVDALQLMKTPGILSGPGTEAFTKVVATLKNAGIINTATKDDPTAIQQEIIKKLHQYVSGNPIAQRSDAAQTLSEASSPSPNVQILPALMRLTKDAIAYDRVKAAMPTAFTKSENGKDVRNSDYTQYGDHIARFPQSVDKRAFILNFEDDDGKNLVDEMTEKEKSKKPKDQAEAAKFFKSLRIAKKQGYYD